MMFLFYNNISPI